MRLSSSRLGGGLASIRAVSSPGGSGKDPASRALSIFADVFALTRSNYVEVDGLEGAAVGRVRRDVGRPGSVLLLRARSGWPPTRLSRPRAAVDPGLLFARRGGYPYVVATLPGSPAEKAGVKSGDLIDTVDGKPARNSPLWKVQGALSGPEGMHVLRLAIVRGGEDKHVTFKIPRSRYEPPPLDAVGEGRRHREGADLPEGATAEYLKEAIEEAIKKGAHPDALSMSAAPPAARSLTPLPRLRSSLARGRSPRSFRASCSCRLSRPRATASGTARPWS